MAEFKIFCPGCGQHIMCDEGYRGVQITCPACNQSFVVSETPHHADEPDTTPVRPPKPKVTSVKSSKPRDKEMSGVAIVVYIVLVAINLCVFHYVKFFFHIKIWDLLGVVFAVVVGRAIMKSPRIGFGYFFSLFVPIVGFFYGIYLLVLKRVGHGATCMVISIITGYVCFNLFFTAYGKEYIKFQITRAEDARQKPDAALRPVQGAYGFNLGDRLPLNYNVTTNEDYSLSYVPADHEDAFWCLYLTEDKRIAAITVMENIADKSKVEAVKSVLREKYGFREISHDSFMDMIYFGPENRQATMTTKNGDKGYFIIYQDKDLYRIAREQNLNRKAAAEGSAHKKLSDDLKSKL